MTPGINQLSSRDWSCHLTDPKVFSPLSHYHQPDDTEDWKEFHVPHSTDHGHWRGPTRFAIARQPIFDRCQQLYGYELLFRNRMANHFSGNPDHASYLLASKWQSLNLNDLTRSGLAFVNCTRMTLLAGWADHFPQGTVLEILENIEPDPVVIDVCRRLKALGYRIALDDFEFSKKLEALIELADYIKIDFRALDMNQRDETLRRLRGFSGVLVAEKVETEEEYRLALEQGFELFQGFFLALPKIFVRRYAASWCQNETNGYCRL
jgi:EAL and modified HD-GYP domain-containing signal transduction protein